MSTDRESGFTLVELLVALSIGSIIVFVLGQAVAVGLKTTTATGTTLLDAVHSQALTADLLTDIGGARTIGTSSPCAPPESVPAGTTVLWTRSFDDAVEIYFVAHTAADADANITAFSQLKRQTCEGQPVTLAAWADPTDPPAPLRMPKILCDGRDACGGETPLGVQLAPADTVVIVDEVAGFPDPDNVPGAAYSITVGTEAMTVTDVDVAAKTLNVTRPSPAAVPHTVPTSAVTYRPARVSVQVPCADSASRELPAMCSDADDFNLTVTPSSS